MILRPEEIARFEIEVWSKEGSQRLRSLPTALYEPGSGVDDGNFQWRGAWVGDGWTAAGRCGAGWTATGGCAAG